MARKAILDTYYSFTPSTRTIVIPRPIPQERLILITDVTTNQVIFNFSDTNLKATSYIVGPDTTGLYQNATTTTITLNYNTTALSSTDKLQIVVDEYDEKISPSESYLDPINKLRVSTPQSLIDTDYEYSIQTTKWEQLAMLNNRPFAYYDTATGNLNLIDIQAVNGSRTYTANTTGTTPPAVGSPVTIIDSLYTGADGLYIVDANNNLTNSNASGAANTFTYTGKYFFTGPSGSVYNSGVTIGYQGRLFSNTAIAMASAAVGSGTLANVVTITTSTSHGLLVGNEIALTGASTANGSWIVSTVISPTSFQFNTTGTFTPTTGAVTITNANLYPRPMGFATHRSFDGGVRFSTNSSSHNQQYIRQTRRYFRYQSGKGIQMSTGTTLKSQMNLDGISSNGTTVTVTTKDPHNITINYVTVYIDGCNETAYNGSYIVSNVLNPYQFQYVANTTPSASIASGNYVASCSTWYGGTNRIGIFDQQNGLFWEYDGQLLNIVRRSSTYQISGQASVTNGSTTVTSSTLYPTFFSKQLTTNDFIVIKGMSYRVAAILSDQSIQIQPAYRGITASTVVISKTVDTRINQAQFNIDRLDGTGPSGYKIDLTKMQMFYIDYSWYGAGFIRFGVRGADGNVFYCHKMINNNINYLAYMRSGNLPGRYETNTFSRTTFMTGGASGAGTTLQPTDTTIYVANTFGFPSTGTLKLSNSNTGGLGIANVEYVNYVGTTSNSFTNLTRGQAGNTAIYCNTTLGNSTIAVAASNGTSGIQVGQYVYGPNIAPTTYVTSYVANTTITLNQAALGNTTAGVYTLAPLANLAQTFIYTTTAQTAVELHGPQFSPEINHWGTSAIMDGGFTTDKSFIFTKGMTTPVLVSAGASQALMSFRIAPSASNGIGSSQLGVREIINRMQQLPFEVDMYANGSFLVTVTLNATTSNTVENWTNAGGSSLSQYIFHTAGTTVTTNTGEAVFGFYLNSAQGTYATTQQDLTQLLAIGSSILSGGSANAATNIYPNGPDVLTFSVQNIDTAARSIVARYSWNEAQA
jgi:hypothetical protein